MLLLAALSAVALSAPSGEGRDARRKRILGNLTDSAEVLSNQKGKPSKLVHIYILPKMAGSNCMHACIRANCNTITIPFFFPADVPLYNCKRIKEEIPNAPSGIYTVQSIGARTYKVFCDMDLQGGGWTVILRRKDGSTSFDRKWSEYMTGFGSLDGNYFLGLENINALTDPAFGKFELWVGLEKHDLPNLPQYRGIVTTGFAHYKEFKVGDAQSLYQLTVSGYQSDSTAGDSFTRHDNAPFSTPDRDHDANRKESCAQKHSSGWWFTSCRESNLAGKWVKNGGKQINGIVWESFSGDEYSLKTAVMAVRPID